MQEKSFRDFPVGGQRGPRRRQFRWGYPDFQKREFTIKTPRNRRSQKRIRPPQQRTSKKFNYFQVEYKRFATIGSQIIFGFFLKNQVDIKIKNKDEEFLTEAIMILYNHEIHEIAHKWVKQMVMEEEEKNISFEKVRTIL